MITGIIVAAVVVGCVGIILGFFLGIAGEKFKVETDPREDAILEVLPGNNCGGCGYAGCSGLAAAIAKGEAPVNQCPVGGEPVAVSFSYAFLAFCTASLESFVMVPSASISFTTFFASSLSVASVLSVPGSSYTSTG